MIDEIAKYGRCLGDLVSLGQGTYMVEQIAEDMVEYIIRVQRRQNEGSFFSVGLSCLSREAAFTFEGHG